MYSQRQYGFAWGGLFGFCIPMAAFSILIHDYIWGAGWIVLIVATFVLNRFFARVASSK